MTPPPPKRKSEHPPAAAATAPGATWANTASGTSPPTAAAQQSRSAEDARWASGPRWQGTSRIAAASHTRSSWGPPTAEDRAAPPPPPEAARPRAEARLRQSNGRPPDVILLSAGGLLDAVIVRLVDAHWLSGALPGLKNARLAEGWVVPNLRPRCPPKNVYLSFWPGCRMRPKSLPEAADSRGLPHRRPPGSSLDSVPAPPHAAPQPPPPGHRPAPRPEPPRHGPRQQPGGPARHTHEAASVATTTSARRMRVGAVRGVRDLHRRGIAAPRARARSRRCCRRPRGAARGSYSAVAPHR